MIAASRGPGCSLADERAQLGASGVNKDDGIFGRRMRALRAGTDR